MSLSHLIISLIIFRGRLSTLVVAIELPCSTRITGPRLNICTGCLASSSQLFCITFLYDDETRSPEPAAQWYALVLCASPGGAQIDCDFCATRASKDNFVNKAARAMSYVQICDSFVEYKESQ